jgi:pyruvate/2-oxoglutarate dehydrogenase complex dihydrolipoamide dehydrogenase (E3) component
MYDCDLVVIGGGAGGLVVASVAGQLGLKVTLIEKQPLLGGDCLHYGCVPSKALLKSAHVAHAMRTAADVGLGNHEPAINLSEVNASIQQVIDTIQVHDSHDRFESYGIEIITGEAVFTDAHTVEVLGKRFTSKRFVVATGSSAWIPPTDGLENIEYLTNEDMFSLKQSPKKLLILGAGPIGVEIAQAYSRLGSKVVLIEMASRILPRSDQEISAALTDVLVAEGIEIICGQSAKKITQQDNIKTIILDDGQTVSGDQLLVAVGRRAVVNGLGLENAGVKYTERGIDVNSKMQTSQRHIYACGDVTGLYPLTHVAEQQAGVVIANCIFRVPKKMSYKVVPTVVYTEPECAEVGISEEEAKDASFDVVRFEMKDLDRAVAERSTAGFAKLIVKKGRLVGAQIIGNHAGETIHELVLAIQHKMKLSDITGLIHAYPSYAQVNRRVAGQYFKDKLFSEKTKKVVRWLNRWLP